MRTLEEKVRISKRNLILAYIIFMGILLIYSISFLIFAIIYKVK